MTWSPFFIVMHLSKLPTIFVKDGEERKAFYTVQARELLAAGWVEKDAKPENEKVEPKVSEEKKTVKADPKPAAKTEAKPKAVRFKSEESKEAFEETEE